MHLASRTCATSEGAGRPRSMMVGATGSAATVSHARQAYYG